VRQIIHTPRLQPKLTVSAPEDASEREADQIADQVMRMPESDAITASPPSVQRMCTGCDEEDEVRRFTLVNVPTPQTTVRGDEEQTQVRRLAHSSPDEGSLADAADRGVASKGSGRPLAESTRQFFEPRFNADFSSVRIHDGSSAARSAHELNARAFTHGSDIWLGSGEGEHNRSLLAHELVHVVQQRRAPGLPAALRRYRRTNTAMLWDVYDGAGRDPAAVTDLMLRTTIEYEDYTRADLEWRFSDPVAIAALRRSMDLFGSGVRGRGPNYVRTGRETRRAAHGISSILVNELGFTGDLMITSVTGGLGGSTGTAIDSPDGSTAIWTIGGPRRLVAYVLGTAPSMFGRFSVSPAVTTTVPDVQVRALVDGTIVAQASGLQISGGAIERAPGSGLVTNIAGVAAIPGADVGLRETDFSFETSTDGGSIWFPSGSAQVRIAFTASVPSPPGGILREDVLDWGGLVISSAASAPAELRRLVKSVVIYNPREVMPPNFDSSDAVMACFTTPHQCDSQAYLLRYLALSFGIPAEVVYFWLGTTSEIFFYRKGGWWGPSFQCDRPAEDWAPPNPHFTFHALTQIGGTLHDPSYDFAGLPGILEWAPGATQQFGSRTAINSLRVRSVNWTCPH
jgi:hypothetical protein